MLLQRTIAVAQILGAILGMGLLANGAIHGGISGFWFLAVGMYALIGISGVCVWRGTAHGLRWGVAAQAIQIPWIATAHFTYRLCAGAGAWCGWWFGAPSSSIARERCIGSTFVLEYRSGFGPWLEQMPHIVGVNVVALAAAGYLIWRIRNPHTPVYDFSETSPANPN